MKRLFLFLLLFLSVSGCGFILPYAYDAASLDDLRISMPKDKVRKALGKPDRVIQNENQLTVWEYHLYPKRSWFGYLIHCPWHPYCYFPAEPRLPYLVAFRQDEVCLWGDSGLVRHMASRVCEPGRGGRDPWRGAEMAAVQFSVVPVFMPPRIATPIRRLAIIPQAGTPATSIASWLDMTLNFLRHYHPQVVLVEREDFRTILDEIGMQYTGRVDDETIVRLGKFTGADSLLTYQLTVAESGASSSASFELRLLNVENGTTLFRQNTTAVVQQTRPGPVLLQAKRPLSEAGHQAVGRTASYNLAALTAAFGDNPLGIVPDYAWTGEGVRLFGVLQGSLAFFAGLKPGDLLLSANDRPLRSWTELRAVPARLTVERDDQIVQVIVEP